MNYAGFTPLEALKCATNTRAEIMGRADEIGTLEKSELTALLVVDGNVPSDIRTLQDCSHFLAAMRAE